MVSPQEVWVAERIIRAHVLRGYEEFTASSEPWRNLPEIPNNSEIMPDDDKNAKNKFPFEEWNEYQKDLLYNADLPKNIIEGPWPSKEAYIAAHYQILREDAIADLRNAVKAIQREPHMDDNDTTHVYTHVHFKGMVLSQIGPAFRIEFSHDRAGKQIRWQQSHRLRQGTMVALSPMSNSFGSVCKIAIVAARPFEGGLDQNPPQIDLFWGDVHDTVFDPVEPYMMVEARTGYFESSRHMLVALQKLRTEKFLLSKHLAELDPNIGFPKWLEERRYLNLTSLIQKDLNPTMTISAEEELALVHADVSQGFPNIPTSGMDKSQLEACERMITKKVSIIQGPPGTGKTFTSVSALRVLIENMEKDCPPIIISAQTNHALDQLLNHILAFEPNVLRLGGRSDKENIEIQKRTLYTLRSTTQDVPNGYRGMKRVKKALAKLQDEILETMDPLVTETVLSEKTLFQAGIITEIQKNSLYGESTDGEAWANAQNLTPKVGYANALHQWVGTNLIPMPRSPLVNHGLPMEESDLKFEQLQEFEEENEENPDDNGLESLSGLIISFGRTMTGKCPLTYEDKKMKQLLTATGNLLQIQPGARGQVYRYFEKQLNKIIRAKLMEQLTEYKSAVDSIRVAKWLNNFRLIKHLGVKIIGCTTTGLSKYRGFLASFQPRTLLIEEAAETLEGTIMAGMFDSLEQLILVGDHKQLQANANIRALLEEPYNLSVSMFERLVENSIGFTMLNQQRRMISDIRKLLCIETNPFYENLQDHPSVLDRETNRVPVPGMGGKDTYFFHHNWPEVRSSDMSQCNPDEAEMIVGFFNYLVLNGVPCSRITVLTFYNGQRKTILQTLKRHHSLGSNTYFNVFTVDSYQGEENDIILLSLVRSNNSANIGFLDSQNRVVVALSRARRGLFIFGNAVTLTTLELPYGGDREGYVRDPMWQSIIHQMRRDARFDLQGGLPITCSRHRRTLRIYDADGWTALTGGGCNEVCAEVLSCGHLCPYTCHSLDHSRIFCASACIKVLDCGHGCSGQCGEECSCAVFECRTALWESSIAREEQNDHDIRLARNSIRDGPPKMKKTVRSLVKKFSHVMSSNPPKESAQTRQTSTSGPPEKGPQSHYAPTSGYPGKGPQSHYTSTSGPPEKAPQSHYASTSGFPKKSTFESHDVRKTEIPEMKRRENPGPFSTGRSSRGHGLPNTRVFGQRHTSSIVNDSLSKHPAINAWKTWDAKKADRDANADRLRDAALPPKFDPASLVYNDMYRAVKIDENGVRVRDTQSSVTTIIPRKDPSFLAPKGTSITADSKALRDFASSPNYLSKPVSHGPLTQSVSTLATNTNEPKSGSSGATQSNPFGGAKRLTLPSSPRTTLAESATIGLTGLSIDDLIGLEIVPQTFGTAEDLDKFEKYFG